VSFEVKNPQLYGVLYVARGVNSGPHNDSASSSLEQNLPHALS